MKAGIFAQLQRSFCSSMRRSEFTIAVIASHGSGRACA
jgi:hypothetical protein